MKKLFYIAALCSALAVGIFSSCTKDDKDKEDKNNNEINTELIVGKWELAKSISEEWESGEMTDSKTKQEEASMWIWEFKTDGTLVYTYDVNNKYDAYFVQNQKYEIKGTKLNLCETDDPDDVYFYEIEKLASDELIVYQSEEEDAALYITKMVFKKLK